MKSRIKYLLILILLIFGRTSFAQDKKLVTLDVPLMPVRKGIDISRIEGGTVNAGGNLSLWEKDLRYDQPLFTPEFNFISGDFRAKLGGGLVSGYDNGKSRRTRYFDGTLEGSVWAVLLGADGFIEEEKVPEVVRGIGFKADFSRLSYGGKGWTGIKMGDFSNNFLLLKAGWGYIRTDGRKKYSGEEFQTSSHYMYLEDFTVRSAGLESGFNQRYLAENIKAELNYYRRELYSPDPLKFGSNKFRDLKIQGTLEIIPLPNHDFARILLRGSKTFYDKDSLMFRNDPPDVQVILRFVFN